MQIVHSTTCICWGISNQILISVPSYLNDVQPVICYHYTSVSCYAIIYNGFGDSGTQRGRYGGLNYALCLETMPRQRLTTHPDDQELKCQQCVFYGKCLKTTLHVVV